ncbi:hypothetical protein CQW23_23653 [Capsicum baccatum]|uniref:Uncharacterized protein n=1 Tax=Capsicum baccatum TaxID=33114 RepID=A0A2G2VSN4_CAPBA|nr:hypothetical protein CQW23_23653 [Capsicum baccatum]
MTKLAHFLLVRTNFSIEDYARLYLHEIVKLHGVLVSIISDRVAGGELWRRSGSELPVVSSVGFTGAASKIDLLVPGIFRIFPLWYFASLQKELESYDCILYEMVASRESLDSRKSFISRKKLKCSRSQGFNIIGFIQQQMARFLTLDFQLDCLDYEGENRYHTILILRPSSYSRDITLRSTKELMQPAILDDLSPWRSKLLWASWVLPMPLVGLLIIGSVYTDVKIQPSESPELEALSRLDFGATMKIKSAIELSTSDYDKEKLQERLAKILRGVAEMHV